METKEVQLRNASLFNSVTVAGMVIVIKDPHCLKEAAPTMARLSDKVTNVRLSQSKNA
jgi:hypothetical protein